jgi:hypothetical protein
MRISEWTKLRAEIKRDFERAGVTHCQMCGSHSGGVLGLSFAHAKKRRDCVTDEDKRTIALLCVYPCHEKLEFGPKDVMRETVTRLHQEVYEQIDTYA